MKPKHHHELATFYALELVRLAAAKRGATDVPVDALLIGNWFTDVSQFLLPIRARRLRIRACLLANANGLFDKLKGFASDLESGASALDAILDNLAARSGAQVKSLRSTLAKLLKTLAADVQDLRKDLERRLGPDGTALRDLALDTAEELARYLARARQRIDMLKDGDAAARASEVLLRLRVSALVQQLISAPGAAAIDALRKEAEALIEYMFPADGAKAEHFENIARSVLSVWGYFLFVHPEHSKAPPRFPFDIFLEIRDQFLTLSFSHDHCDRPPSARLDDYAVERDLEPTLYGYLQQDRQHVSGLLYEVEKEWAYGYFERDDQPIKSDHVWHLGLAKLGKALHAVQDFYAHTTFVEHAMCTLNARNNGPTPSDVVLRRLKRWLPECRAYADLDDEPKVISGYYDGVDTALSIIDFVLDALGYERTDPAQDAKALFGEIGEIAADPLRYGQRRIRELGEILADPQAALDDITNETAQSSSVKETLERYGIVDMPRTSAPLSDDKIALLLEEVVLERVPPKAAEWIVTQVLFLRDLFRRGRLLYAYVSLVWDLVSASRELTSKEKGGTPKTNAIGLLSEAAAGMIVEYAAKSLLTRKVDEWLRGIGSERIGCHSLLAKDSERSEYFVEAMKLAAFADAYVVGLMVRAHKNATAEELRVVKWEEVLDYFMHHPLEAQTLLRGRTLETTTEVMLQVAGDNETAATLAQRFAASASIPPEDASSYGYTAFDWKVIADRNFGTYGLDVPTTQWIMSEALKQGGVPRGGARGGMYCFRPGALVVIPYQTIGLSEMFYRSDEVDWWQPVVEATNLRDIKDSFTTWFQDETRTPLGIAYEPAFHVFDRRRGEPQRVFAELGAQISKPEALRARLRREELAVCGLPATSR